jgi:hypothetical protein
MTSEFKQGLHIEEFVSGGPKNYAYRTVNPATGDCEIVCKVRFIILNYSVSKILNFDVIRDMILRGKIRKRYGAYIEKIKRKTVGGRIDIIKDDKFKMYRVSFFKGRQLADNTPVPSSYING